MILVFRTALRALATLLACLTATATATERPPMLSAEAHHAWRAIGRLNAAGYDRRRLCTATLIAPDLVLSAAHCVLRPDGTAIRLEDLRFVAGWLLGDYAAIGHVSRVSVPPGWRSTGRGRGRIARDVALIGLAHPVTAFAPLAPAPPMTGERIRILGYRADRPHALSDSGECLHGTAAQDARVTDCAATFGTSGAPVLQKVGEGWRVVGIVSGIGGGRTYFAPWRDSLKDELVQIAP